MIGWVIVYFKYKKILLLGFAFFAISYTWALYNSFVPIFISKFVENPVFVGFMMTLHSYAGLFLQPIFGTLSDRTRTRLGRRMPYLLFGMPLAAMLMSSIPFHRSSVSLIGAIVGFNIVIVSLKSPAVSLMPDMTPAYLRSKANGIINFMSGLGAVISFFIGPYLYKIGRAYPFYMASVLMILSLALIYMNIKEEADSLNFNEIASDLPGGQVEKEDQEEYEDDWWGSSRHVVLFLLSIFFCFAALSGVGTFFTMYGKYHLGAGEEDSVRALTFFLLSATAFSLPSGYIAMKIGKRKTILLGLAIMVFMFVCLMFSIDIQTISVLFIFAGICWALLNVNYYPLILSMTNGANIGRFTGYYYLFSCFAAIISPPLFGKLIDIFGYQIFFTYGAICFSMAIILMLQVKTPDV